ncbi:MAG: tetratricopeptide repeat protein [bacterium]
MNRANLLKAGLLLIIAGLIFLLPPAMKKMNAASLCRSADSLAAACEWQEALSKYSMALSLCTDYLPALRGTGDVLRKLGNRKAATGAYEEALKKHPGDKDVRLALAAILVENKEISRAREILTDLVSRRPKDPDVALAWSSALSSSGRLKEGVEALEKAISANIQNAELHYRLAVLLQSIPGAASLNRAIDEYQQALKWNFRMNRSSWNLAELYRRLNKLDEVIAECRLALDRAPNDIAVLNLLGMSLYEKGSLSEAEAIFKNITALDPDFEDSYLSLGRTLQIQGKDKKAISVYKTILKKNPCRSAALRDMGNLMLRAGRREEAIRWYKKAQRCDPADQSL